MAPGVINQMSPQEVYQVLTQQHPLAESRRYLYKVSQAERTFRVPRVRSAG
jgi:membrane-bound lytic murein transglycosylase C